MADYSTVPPPASGAPGGGGGGGGGVNDAFKDALQRARQIAAKIGGDAGTSMNSNDYGYGGQKRPLEDGDQPDAKKVAPQNDSFGNQLPPMHQQQRSVMTEEYKVPDGMVGFIIGRGGEQISRIQQESGCKIQIAPDSGGLPERSCMLTGTPESVQSAKRLLDQIVEKGRPAPGFHHGDGPGNAVQEIMIPASKAGLVIGKGGETIKQLQERAGVKMVMIQDGPQNTGADKPLRITGDPYKVQQAKEMVLELIRDQGGFREVRNEYGSRIGGNEGIDVPIPRFAVGIVIGRNGEMIKKIQNDAGVRIQFKPDDGTTPDRIAQITGPPDRCQHAAEIITDLLRSVQAGNPGGPGPGGRGRGRGQGNWNMGPPGGLQEFNFIVPTGKTGLIIGKGGETIKSISQQSGARIELQRNPPPNADPNMKMFTIRGTPQQIDYARQLIEEKIGVSQEQIPIQQRGQLIMLTTISSKHSHHLQPLRVDQLQPKLMDKVAIKTKMDKFLIAEDVDVPLFFIVGFIYWVNLLQGDQPNPAPAGQVDYTKAWEEYYKKMGY
ncbi:far upstream element-binding protein 1 isoform x6 [Limosa lapponica baueri]|uniref:Far upstream element-binding protein 1 n=1 Tax=Limosa lapponica baueri TaxID=1758121 RepID=A0A2I0UET7_LIMLA|nr:far upstream element-binding protein 1 isoform x6 [Limosa lapponica baueri]